jgi:hypothetical protein
VIFSRQQKQLGHRARDDGGRFCEAKVQPLPADRRGSRYRLKAWHLKALVLSIVFELKTTEVAKECGRHRTSVWRVLKREDLRIVYGTLWSQRPAILFGIAGEITVEMRGRYSG